MTSSIARAFSIASLLLPVLAEAQTQPAPGPVAQPPALMFKQLTEDATLKTPSGGTFTVARGWHVAQAPDLIVIQEPDKELSAAFVESAAPTVEEAIASAWKRWRPDFARAVRQTTKPPVAQQGWDEIAQIAYETGADERRIVVGAARRKGKTYYVTLIDGSVAAAERRRAQLNTAIGSLEIGTRVEENLAGRKPHPLDAARAAACWHSLKTRAG